MRAPKLYRFVLAVLACSIVPAKAETIVALMSDKKLRYFSSTAPGAWLRTVNLTGIPAAESPAAMDFRPDASLVVVTRQGTTLRPYTVDPNSGAALQSPFTFTTTSTNTMAFDTFPTDTHSNDLVMATEDDVMRRFFYTEGSSGGLTPKTLAYDNTATDGDPVDIHSGADPTIIGFASTNGFPGAQASVLYGIDSLQKTLVKIDWETGSIDTIATLRTEAAATLSVGLRTGFDISGVTALAYLARGSGDATTLLTVDLTTGATVNVGSIGPSLQPVGVNVVDISTLPATNVVNLSTRSRVGTGDEVMIAGFIAQGGATTRLIIRGIGPSLTAAGIANALTNPVLAVFNGNGVQIATNDNWRSNQETEIMNTHLQPANDLEAAIVRTYSPGQYTAIVSGKNGGTGVGLVEIYRLPDL
jgi:uncharacterized protein DUF4394